MLSIQRILLLALLALAPALALAQAQQQVWNQSIPSKWSTRLNEAPVGTINLFDAHRNTNEVGTGLKFAHSSECVGDMANAMLYGSRDKTSGSRHRNYFIYRSGNVESRAEALLTLDDPTTQHVTLNLKADQTINAEITLEFNVSMSALCDRWGTYRLARLTIKLLAQRNIRTAESLAAAGAFRTDRLLASSTAVTTGIVFQRGTMRCPTNMTLLNHSDYMRLQHLNPTGNALTGALATAHSAVAMGGTNARALALLFKAGATVTAGTLTIEVKVDSPASNTACPAAFARTITAKVTAAASLAWTTGSNNATAATAIFATPVSGDQPTGIKIHRYAGTCATMNVALPNNQVTGANNMQAQVRDIMQLRGMNGSTNAALTGSPGHDVTVGSVASSGGNYARLELKGSPPAGTLTVTAVVSAGCEAVAGLAEPQTLSYLVTVQGNAWEAESKDSAAASGSFVVAALAAASTPTPTGIRLHRSSANCRVFDVTMRSGAGTWLGLLRMTVSSGSTTAVGAQGREFSNVHMQDGNAADNHFRLVFSARANVGARARVERATVEVTPSSTCAASTRPANPLTLTYMVSIRVGYREVGPAETLQAASTLWTNVLRASTTAVPTGIKLHRGLRDCPNTSMRLLNHTGYLRLQPVNAGGALTGSPAVSHANVPMFSGIAANNRALALLFTPRAAVNPGTLTVRILAETDTTRSGCAGALANTITALVTVIDPTAWQAGPNARSQALSVMLSAEIATQLDTGIRFNHYTAVCNSARLVLTDSTVTGASASAQARSIARFSRYTAAGARETVVGHDITITNLARGAHARLELMGTPPLGTLTLQAVATPACASAPGVQPLALAYLVTVQDASATVRTTAQIVQATVGQSTGAAVTRVVGLSAIAAVMGRVAGGGGEGQSLLGLLAAKEEQLESGDIDLRSFLAGQSFALGMDAAASGQPGFGAWGRAEFMQLEEGEAADAFRQDGDMFSAQIGADYRLAGGALLGVGYGRHELDTDYAGSLTGADSYAGNYVLELDVVQPYASMPLGTGDLAGAVAVGSGEAEVKEAGADASTAYDADYLGWGLGYRASAGGGLEVEGAVSGGSLDIPDLGADGVKSDNMSLRTGLRYSPIIDLGEGSLRPTAGVAVAVDWGDDPGHKYEFSAGLGYAGARLAAAAEYIYVGMDEGDLTASGGSIDVRFSTAAGNLGLGLAATPAHGPAAGADLLANPETGMRGSAEIGYGLAVNGGVLTPYGGWSFATEAGEVGLRLRQGDGGSWLLRWREDDRDMIAIEFNLLGD